MKDYFQVGQILRVSIKSKKDIGSNKYEATLHPSEINRSLNFSRLQQGDVLIFLEKQLMKPNPKFSFIFFSFPFLSFFFFFFLKCLVGSIHSIEDHGYVINFGIKDANGFLKKTDAESYISKVNQGQFLEFSGSTKIVDQSTKTRQKVQKEDLLNITR